MSFRDAKYLFQLGGSSSTSLSLRFSDDTDNIPSLYYCASIEVSIEKCQYVRYRPLNSALREDILVCQCGPEGNGNEAKRARIDTLKAFLEMEKPLTEEYFRRLSS